MDRKSIAVIVVCIVLMFLWQGVLVPKYFSDKRPIPVAPSNAPTASVSGTQAVASVQSGPAVVLPAGTDARLALTNAPEQLLSFTNENATYVFTSRGGGLKEIQLTKFPETIMRKRKEPANVRNVATLNTHAHLPVLTVLGGEALMGDGVFALSATANGVRAEKTLTNGLRLVKEFTPSTNYLVRATVRWENTTSNNLVLPAQEWVVGTASPMGAYDDGMAVGLMWFDGKKSHDTTTAFFSDRKFGCIPTVPKTEYRDGGSNIVWVAAHNQFFAMIAMPETVAQQVVARPIEIPRPTEGRFKDGPLRKGMETIMTFSATNVASHQALEQRVNLFIGPKEYKTLASIANTYSNDVDQAMGFGWAFFAFFAKGLLLIMNWMHTAMSLTYGWAIIVLTVLLKIVFWPLTAASTRASQRMAALAPQITALKEKYKDDPAKFSQKQMEFYRDNKINPVAGCLPMLVQLPVFFGFFSMLRTAIELRGASFFWAIDLSQPDTLFTIPGIGIPFNLLPLLYIASALWQTHITPMSPGMDPTQQKLMRWMPLMFLVFLYNFSSGLALYMTVNNLLTIFQTWWMKRNQPLTPPAAVAPVTASALTPASKKKK